MKAKTIGIIAHPGKSNSEETASFHYPLSSFVEFIHDNGMVVETMEEWVSDKKKYRDRWQELRIGLGKKIPLFLMVEASKKMINRGRSLLAIVPQLDKVVGKNKNYDNKWLLKLWLAMDSAHD